MLFKAEKIITHENYLLNSSEYDVFQLVKHELADKIFSAMIDKKIVKLETSQEMHDDFGAIVRIRATVMAYNPDD